MWAALPSAKALSHIDAGPSGSTIEEVDSKETEVVYSEEAPGYVEAEEWLDRRASSPM